MIIPYNTDAPVYHFPVGTIGLIAFNTLIFLLTGCGSDASIERWGLEYGNGLHPVEWLTSNFLHEGWLHLIGNMLFLWGFGMVVEGKLGWQRFLIVYLGLGIVECGLEQTLALGTRKPEPSVSAPAAAAEKDASESDRDHTTNSVGASAIVYGLMALALVWAPLNELSCVLLIYLGRFVLFDLAIWQFSLIFVGLEELNVLFTHETFTVSLLHLLGAALGFGLGVAMVKNRLVDCEGWDLFNVITKFSDLEEGFAKALAFLQPDEPTSRPKKKKKKNNTDRISGTAPGDEEQADRGGSELPAKTLRALKEGLGAGQGQVAHSAYLRILHFSPDWKLPDEDLMQMIELLLKESDWGNSVPLMEQYVARSLADSDQVRLRLAKILLTVQRRPSRAMRVLGELSPDRLPPSLEQIRAKLAAQAQQMLDDGVLELDGEAWQ